VVLSSVIHAWRSLWRVRRGVTSSPDGPNTSGTGSARRSRSTLRPRKNTRVEERAAQSPEEILERLERYVELHRGRSEAPAPVDPREIARAAETVVDVSSVPVDTLIPSRIPQRDDAPRRHRFTAEIAPAVVAVSICAFVILLSESFDSVVAISVGAVLMLGGVVALVRRVPLARAYTFGLVAAAVLIRFS